MSLRQKLILPLTVLLLAPTLARAQSITAERLTHLVQSGPNTIAAKPANPFTFEIQFRRGSTDTSQWGPAFYKPGSGGIPAAGSSTATNTGTLNFTAAPNNGLDFEFRHIFNTQQDLDVFYPIAPTDGGQYGVKFQGASAPTPSTFTAGLVFQSDVGYPSSTPRVTAVNNGAVWSYGTLRVKNSGVTTISLSEFTGFAATPYGSIITAGLFRANGGTVEGAEAEAYYIPSLGVNQAPVTTLQIDGSRLQPGQDYTLELQFGVFASHPAEGFPNGVNFQGLAVYYKVTTVTVRAMPATVRSDFNADGKTDLLWRYPQTGGIAYWLLNGTSPTAKLAPYSIDPNWRLVGTGDFNEDGKEDLVFRHSSSGMVAYWMMDGTNALTKQVAYTVDPAWVLSATGDFNGDGATDFCWRHPASGAVGYWLMKGTTPMEKLAPYVVDPNWSICGAADFDADGHTDLVWRHSTGMVAYWLMNGTSATSKIAPYTVDLAWTLEGTGDFNGDAKPDLIFRNPATGMVAYWLMNGTNATSKITPYTVDPNWHIMR